jgi:hypothetical protein
VSTKNRKDTRSVTPKPRTDSAWTFLLVLGLALAVCALLKVPSLFYPGDEMDEQIYWQLAVNLAQGHAYSLQGTDLLPRLSPAIYDHPLFHYPPLFPALMVPFVLAGAKSAAITVSWLGHLLAVLAVALVARHLQQDRPDGAGSVTSPAFWVPLLAVCADPLLMFVSRKLWTDSLLSGLVALSVAVFVIADGRRRVLLIVSGVLLGLAALTKLTALLVAPVYLVALVRRDLAWRARLGSIAAVIVPAGLLIVPWCILFYLRCGVFIPPWVKPDAWLIEHNPFIEIMVNRPWYYYAVKLSLTMPLLLVVGWILVRDRLAWWPEWRIRVAAAWFLVILVGTTVMGANGYGFQMRHVAPAVTAVYLLLASQMAQRERPTLLMAAGFTILIGTVTGALYMSVPEFDEIKSLAEVARLIEF